MLFNGIGASTSISDPLREEFIETSLTLFDLSLLIDLVILFFHNADLNRLKKLYLYY